MAKKISSIPGVSSFKDLRGKLPTRSDVEQYKTRSLSKITHIAVHHSAGPQDATPESIAKIHITPDATRGKDAWPGIGYHFCIEKNGTVNWVNNLETISYNVGQNNGYLVGVEMNGNFENYSPSDAQWKSLYAVLNYLAGELNIPTKNIMGHKEFPGQTTACPGKNVNMNTVRSKVKPGGKSSGGGTGFSMPTASSYNGDQKGVHNGVDLPSAIAGTDKWNDVMYRVGIKEGINPLFLKAIMTTESAGDLKAANPNSSARGLYQMLKSNYGDKFDFNKIMSDAAYATEAACYVIKEKAKNAGKEDVWTVAKYYYSSKIGANYADQIMQVYTGFGGKKSDSVFGMPNGISGDIQENHDTSMGGAEADIIMPEQPIYGNAPSVYDDDYPAHRAAGHPYALRIGDCQFYLPPTYIRVSKQTSIESTDIIRHKSPHQTKSGFSERSVTIQVVFTDINQINGYKIKGPDGQTYYMDGLRSLLAQFRKTPFLPIRNELLNFHHRLYNVALDNIEYSTSPDFDNVIIAQLQFRECTMEPHIHFPDEYFDRMFMYPMFRWWYQQLLQTNREKAYSGTFMRPLENNRMNSELAFRILDRELLNAEINKVEKQELGMYKIAKMKWADIDKTFMKDWPIGDVIVESVRVGIQKSLAPLRLDDQELNAFQDMGGMMMRSELTIVCNRDSLEALEAMVTELEDLSRDFRHKFVAGFGKIGNEIVNLSGMYHFMVERIESEIGAPVSMGNIEASAITGSDLLGTDIVRVKLLLRNFDATQKNNERVNGLNSAIDKPEYYADLMSPIIEKKTDRKHEIIYETQLEKILETVELYPDLELPTYDTLNKIIPKINTLRKKQGHEPLPMEKLKKPGGSIFVDPDFYIAYPTMKTVMSNFDLGSAGNKFLNLAVSGSYAEIGSQDEEVDWDKFTKMMNGQMVDNWKDENGLMSITGNKDIDLSKAGRTRYVQAGDPWNEDKNCPTAQYDPSDLAEQMSHDMMRYGKTGRLVRAFPTYLMIFVDEGMWMDGRRLWNNYYMYHAVKSIEMVKDKNNPVDLAYITMSNIYGAFDHSERVTNPMKLDKPKSIWDRFTSLFDNWNIGWTEQQLQERSQLADEIKVVAGARVHLRLGYGAAPANLPTVFNGHVAEINEGTDLAMVCQSDGVELINQKLSYDPAATTDNEGLGNESRNMFRSILSRRISNYWFATSDKLNIFNNYESYYGIEHFGVVESEASDGLGATIVDIGKWMVGGWWANVTRGKDETGNINSYEVMKNVYRGNQDPSTDEEWLFDGEKNIELSIYNKTAWDVFQTHAAFNPEFICAPHHHGFRSTVFFGMPHWLVKYGYRFKKDFLGKGDDDRQKYDNYLELVKPFQQLHVLSSTTDIIHNDVRASSEMLKHIAVGAYTKGSGQDLATTFAVYADRSIPKNMQKTMLVQTNVSQNYWGPEWLYEVVGMATIGQMLEGIGDTLELLSFALDKVDGWTGGKIEKIGEASDMLGSWAESYKKHVDAERIFRNGEVTARDVAIGTLHKQFAEMYQGELITFGASQIKPHDLIYLSDSHNGVAGTAAVGKITHMMDFQTGFVSSIKADLCAARSDNMERNALMQVAIFVGVGIATITARKLLASKLAKNLAKFTAKSTLSAGKGVLKGSMGVLGKGGKALTRTVGTGWDAIKKGKFDIKGKAGKILKGGKTIIRGNLVLGFVLGFLTMQIDRIMKKELMFNNCIYIYPLWKYGRPFVAGIKGAKYIIPNYIDPRYAPDKIDDAYFAQGVDGQGLGAGSSDGLAPSGSVVHPVPNTIGISRGWRPYESHYAADIRSGPGTGDISGKPVTPVLSIADGTVIKSEDQSTVNTLKTNANSPGRWIWIKHNIGGKTYVTVYMHLHVRKVQKGAKVRAGQQIGIMGNTGASAGTHLHFEICEGDTRVTGGAGNRKDAEKWFQKHGINLAKP